MTVSESVINQLSNEIAALITTIAVAKAKATNIAKLAAQVDPLLWGKTDYGFEIDPDQFEKVRTLIETIAAG